MGKSRLEGIMSEEVIGFQRISVDAAKGRMYLMRDDLGDETLTSVLLGSTDCLTLESVSVGGV